MIFDSPRIQKLTADFNRVPDYSAPKIVFLARSEKLDGERAYIEQLLTTVGEPHRRHLIGRLCSSNDGHHLGAWFEIMLYGWLREVGTVEVQPDVEGDLPDFLLAAGSQRITIEARAILREASEKELDIRSSEVREALRSVHRPYTVIIRDLHVGQKSLNVEELASKITQWLDSSAADAFQYQDTSGNMVILYAQKYTGDLSDTNTISTIGPTTESWITAQPLRNPLKKKAVQHAALRRAGHPYVIAVLLESWQLTAEQVVDAWFGHEQVFVDRTTAQVVGQRFDNTGLLFNSSGVAHTTVTGTLAFRREYLLSLRRYVLHAWYVENPVAQVLVEPSSFPTVADFVVSRRDKKGVWMTWKHS